MRGFSSEDSIESRYVIGPEKILFAGASVHLLPGNFTCWGSEGVKQSLFLHRKHKLNKQQVHRKHQSNMLMQMLPVNENEKQMKK